MRVFVTGGAGFIGTHLCKKLASLHKVTVYDNFSNSNKENFPVMENVKLIVGDILDNSKLLDSMKNHDIVIHLASKTDVIDSIINPYSTFQTNVQGTQNILDSCKFNHISKINYSILRLFNVYGNGHTSGVIANFRKNILENKPLTIFGDGKATRDFIHIDDVIDGIIISMKSISGIYNIASGNGTSIGDLAKLLIRLSETNSEIIHKSTRKGEIIYSVANIDKSNKELGFYPKISLDVGLNTL